MLKILAYVAGAFGLGLSRWRGLFNRLSAFADVLFASNMEDKKSVSGYVVLCGGAAVGWLSRM